ncbi:MAG: alpha/beta hydrolase [Caulobacteraceae bacterium]|nr:MAG: alpha/beta hydrolase [Caulobacteraceae bacterium]
MSALSTNNVVVAGEGPRTIVFAHGFGCDQGMWAPVAGRLAGRATTVLYDHIGAGAADSRAYDPVRHATLHGYAEDMVGVIEALHRGPVTVVGHSVSATIAVLAARARPELFERLVLVCASPRYTNAPDFHGGLDEADVRDLLDLMEKNMADFSAILAPQVAGPGADLVQADWQASVCRADPAIARTFARTTFLSDHRDDYAATTTPTVIIDSAEDLLAPPMVGEWMAAHIPGSRRVVLATTGHSPHMTAPDLVAEVIAGLFPALNQAA